MMAITAVPSSQVAQAPSARAAVLPVTKHPEPSRIAQPSAIARISPEGKLRAEQDRQPEAAPVSPNAVSQAPAVPHRTPTEEATDVAAIAAVAVPAPNPNLPPRQLNEAQPAEPVVKSVAGNVRRDPQPERDAPAPVKLERTEAPAPVANSLAAPASTRPPVEPQRISRNAVAPANEAHSVASAPAKNTPVAHVPVTNSPVKNSSATEHRVNQSRISQTAHDFVAAVNQQQARRSQVKQSAASVSQAPVANAPEPRSAAPSYVRNDSARVEHVVRSAEVGNARADAAPPLQSNSQGNAAAAITHDVTNDVARNAPSTVARAEHNPPPAVVSSRASAPAETISQIQAHSIAAKQQVQTARQNSAAVSLSNQAGGASVDQGGGLAKHLNALANLLTP
jgi:hypothetical protein